jgi:hypothetical protein
MTYHTKQKKIDVAISFTNHELDRGLITIGGVAFPEHNLGSPEPLSKLFRGVEQRIPDWALIFGSEENFIATLQHIIGKVKAGDYEEADVKPSSTVSNADIDPKKIADFLRRPDLIDEIDQILRRARRKPFVRDWANLLISFFSILSYITPEPLSLEFSGLSSGGKTYVVVRASHAFPKDKVTVLSGASGKALQYSVQEVDDFGNRIVNVADQCIVILEKEESKEFFQSLKPIMSHDMDEYLYKKVVRGGFKDEFGTVNFKIVGMPSLISITTRTPDDEEAITRQLIASPDTSLDKVRDGVSAQFRASANPDEIVIHPDLPLLKASIESLNKMEVRNIFAEIIQEIFPSDIPQRMRDAGKLINLINVVTLLHQHQRIKEVSGDRTFVWSTVEDNIIVLMLIDDMLKATLTGIPEDTSVVMEFIRRLNVTEGPPSADRIYSYMVAQDVKSISKENLIKNHIKALQNRGLIIEKKGKRKKPSTYEVQESERQLYAIDPLTPLFIERANKLYPDLINKFSKMKQFSLQIPNSNPTPLIKDVFDSKIETSAVPVANNLMRLCYLRPDKEGNVLSHIAAAEVKNLLYTSKNPFASGSIKEDYTKRMKKLSKDRMKLRTAITKGGEAESKIMEKIKKDESLREQEMVRNAIANSKRKVFKA